MNASPRKPRNDDRAAQVLPEALARWWEAKGKSFAKGRLLVGVSGGADSVALLHALFHSPARPDVELIVAHLDHGLRGAAAAADRRFVVRLARELKLRYRTTRIPVAQRAARGGRSLEMAARDVRYAFFRRATRDVNADAVALGHTRNDQAETLLLRLCRGTGPTGLSGIAPDSERAGLRLVRPMLEVGRDEVIAYLRAHRLRWREDASNRDLSVPRNRIRNDLLPRIRRDLNPAAVEALARAAHWIRDEDRFLESQAEAAQTRCETAEQNELDADVLRKTDPVLRRRIWRRWLIESGVPGERMDAALLERAERLLVCKEGSAWIPLPGNRRLERAYSRIRLIPNAAPAPSVPEVRLEIPGVTEIPGFGWRVEARWTRGFQRRREPGLPAKHAEAWLSRARVENAELTLRGWRPGDRLAPFGLEGSRKLQDIFGDARVPRAVRGRIPVIACGKEIVWLPGYRIARTWAVPGPRAPSVCLWGEFQG